jgi:O-antigen ligase
VLAVGGNPVMRSGRASQPALMLGFVGAALAVGALSTVKPSLAIAATAVAVTLLLIASNIDVLPRILVLAMFAESVSLGGAHVGRLVGPLALFVVAYFLLVRGRVDLKPSLLLGIGGLYGFWVLLSFYWAPSSHFVFVTFLKWALSFAFMLSFAILVRTERQVKLVLGTFVVAAVAFGIVAVLEFLQSGGAQRGVGLEGDPNQFAAYQVIALPMALVLAGMERRLGLRLVYYASVVFLVLSIGASFSRGGLLALGAVVLATLVLPWRVFFARPGQKLAYLGTLFVAAWIVAVLGSAAYLQRIQSILHGSDRGTGRLDLWAAAWNGYSHHLFSGIGAGGFEATSLDLLRQTPGVSPDTLMESRPVHNAYLESLVDLGPIGLTIYLLVASLTLVYLVRAARRFGRSDAYTLRRMTIGLAVSLAGLQVASIFLSNEFGKAIWILMGLALALDRMSSRLEGDSRAAFLEPVRSRIPAALTWSGRLRTE